MDLVAYRNGEREQERINQLVGLVPPDARSVMDIGTRDGYLAKLLGTRGHYVTALDLKQPEVQHDMVRCVQGDVTALAFADDTFDLVLCAEVLEHIAPETLTKACDELQRVTRSRLLIGVPFDEDVRISRTTCYTCGATNPPWSHVNTFTEERLRALFSTMEVQSVTFVGQRRDYTNALSVWLSDWAGNPYGTYVQEEPCRKCGARLVPPTSPTILQRALTKVALQLNGAQSWAMPPKAAWIHILFRKPTSTSESTAQPVGRLATEPSPQSIACGSV